MQKLALADASLVQGGAYFEGHFSESRCALNHPGFPDRGRLRLVAAIFCSDRSCSPSFQRSA